MQPQTYCVTCKRPTPPGTGYYCPACDPSRQSAPPPSYAAAPPASIQYPPPPQEPPEHIRTLAYIVTFLFWFPGPILWLMYRRTAPQFAKYNLLVLGLSLVLFVACLIVVFGMMGYVASGRMLQY